MEGAIVRALTWILYLALPYFVKDFREKSVFSLLFIICQESKEGKKRSPVGKVQFFCEKHLQSGGKCVIIQNGPLV